MDSNVSNFGFAFNNPKFSDRVLFIEILPDPFETQPNGTVVVKQENGEGTSMHREEHTINCSMPDAEDSIASENHDGDSDAMIKESSSDLWIQVPLLRHLLNSGKLLFNHGWKRRIFGEGTSMHREEHTINCSMPDAEDSIASENQDGDSDAMIKESSSGEEATRSRDFSTVSRVKTIHINSAILAIKSPYFYKLFSNGMRESERVATLRIHASEEAALMELLNYMYINSLSTTTHSSLLDILMSADKFDVASCMQYCSERLSKLPMTCDLALSYLDLPSSVLQAVSLQQLTDSVKQFIAVQFRDVMKFENQVLNLSLAGLEAILSSDDIQVGSEDVVYDLVLKWAEVHYPQLEERRGVLETRLRHLIRFPYMTSLKLKKITTGTHFSPEVASEIVLEALYFKAETPYRQRQLALGRDVTGENIVNTGQRFVERAYMYWPVKAVELKLPLRQCVAYLDLKREECVRLFPAERICSEAFPLGRHGLFLLASCNMDLQNVSQCFGLYLGMEENGSASLAIDFEFASWSKLAREYVQKYIIYSSTLKGEYDVVGCRNLFGVTWATFIADGSPYFINDILHLRAVVTID